MSKELSNEKKVFSSAWWRDVAYLNVGTLLTAVGVYFFKFPNHFTTGGVSGMAILINKLAPALTTATVNLLLNVILLVIGVIFLGKGFGLRTGYATIMYSLLTMALEKIVPMEAPMTSQPLMELLFAVGLPSVGAAILFDVQASSGGTDVIAMLIKKYARINIGVGLIIADLAVAIGACLAFGMETGLFSLFGIFLKSVLVDTVMDNLRICKVFQIITDYPEPICRFITDQLNHSATITEGHGAFTQENRKVIMAVVNRSQAVRLQMFVRATDPHSFITITSSSEIIGKGFRGVTE